METIPIPVGIANGRSLPARLDGWKSIAAHFGRDRTTVIRWARERGLPVHRLPGGKTATVYALRHELDCWAGLIGPDSDPVAPSPPVRPAAPQVSTTRLPPATVRRRRLRHWLAGLAAAVGIGVPSALLIAGNARHAAVVAPPIPSLPTDPVVARRFLTARDLTADREALGLERAIGLLETVVAAEPRFAPGQASLAEALLLSREFGMRADVAVFARARGAARAAVGLNPDLAAGHRMLGFIAYWGDHDMAAATKAFRRAIALNPDDALSHFWYGNILSDRGDHAAALTALDRARLLQPGSVAIRTDLAWARWAAGDDTGVSTLDAIARRHPDFAVAQDCLAIIALVRGDYAGYARHFARFATLRRDAGLRRRASAIGAALHRGGDVVRREIMAQATTEIAANVGRTQVMPAVIASVADDRAQLRSILLVADRREERWGDAGLTLRLARAWRLDPEISRLIARRRSDTTT